MERILSEQFVSTFLIPYIKVHILSNVEQDPVIQKIFNTEVPLEDTERTMLDVNYFKNTATIFETDLNLRRVFWNQFTDFVRIQRKICSDNLRLLAFRTLPDPVIHEFSNEAQQNLLKFAYQVANAVQDYKIAQHIKNKEMNGEISKEKAEDLISKLEAGKLVLVKDKAGKEKILEEEEIKRALANVAYQAQLYSDLQVSGAGEELVVYPDELPPQQLAGQPKQPEKGMTLSNLEMEIYEKQATRIEVMLEDSGLYVEAKLKPDKTGMVRGYVIDKKTRERLLVEVNTNKPNSKFRFSFVNKPGKSFLMDENEIQKYFKEGNKSAQEVSDIKEKEAMERHEMFPAKAPAEPKKQAKPGAAGPAGLAAVSPVPQGNLAGDFRRQAMTGAALPINIIAAKEALLKKKSLPVVQGGMAPAQPQPAEEPEKEQYAGIPEQPQPQYTPKGAVTFPSPAVPPTTPKKGLTPAKITGIAVAAGIGGPMIFTLFT